MLERIVLGGGCFWGLEAVFGALAGVEEAVSGYAGGDPAAARYDKVCSGETEHAEVVQVTYDPAVIPVTRLLEIFFLIAHDPTEVNRQGPDVGPQYRSVIYYTTDAQRVAAQTLIKEYTRTQRFPRPIATTCEQLQAFYPAEEYHQNYVARNPWNPYVCQSDKPKLQRLREQYPELLKSS